MKLTLLLWSILGGSFLLTSQGVCAALTPRKHSTVTSATTWPEPDNKYFYDNPESAPIIEYKGTNKGDFTKSKNPRIVNLYEVYCPACQNFKSKYIDLAKKVQATPGGENVEFYAVSCITFQDVCHSGKFTIEGFPSLIAFSSDDGGKSGGNTLRIRATYKVSDVFEALGLPLAQTKGKIKQDQMRTPSTSIERKLDENNDGEDPDDSSTPTEDNEEPSNEMNEEDGEKSETTDNEDEERSIVETGSDIQIVTASNGNGPKNSLAKDAGFEADKPKNEDELEDSDGGEEEASVPEGKDVLPRPVKPITLVKDAEGDEPSEIAEPIPNRKKPKSTRQATPAEVQGMEKFARDMDRWRDLMKERRKRLEGRRGRFGGPRPPTFTTVSGEAVPTAHNMTMAMKAVTNGTKEYNERRQAMLKLVEKLKERRIKNSKGKTTTLKATNATMFVKGKFPFKVQARPATFAEKGLRAVPLVKKYFSLKPEEENVLDASLSFIHGLKYGVYNVRGKPLPETRKQALKDWLDLLAISLPVEWGIHTTIDQLRSNIDIVAQHERNLERILDKSGLSGLTWSRSCTKGRASAGFSCGFWKLLHIMTIGVADHRGGLNLIETGVVDSSVRVFSPSEAAQVWRNYMEEFFTCTECRTEFVNQFDACMFRRCDRLNEVANSATVADWKELAKYAWEVHNSVSIRVAENRAKDKSLDASKKYNFIQALYPSIEQCLACYKEDGSWNEDAVFLFLEKTYWSGSVVDPKISRFLSYDETTYYQTSQFRALWWMSLAALLIFVATRRQINKSSLRRTMVAANSIVSRQVVSRVTGGKFRTN